ncbi:MAG TPA: hypothetical protein VGL58_12890 [Caulobacteraceae bacterium]|jgi:hypothetical protein
MRALLAALAIVAAAPCAVAQSDPSPAVITKMAPHAPMAADQKLYGKPLELAPDTTDVGVGWQHDHSDVVLGYDQRDRARSPDPSLNPGPQYPGQPPQDDSGVVGLSISLHP